jgi:xylose isomerase
MLAGRKSRILGVHLNDGYGKRDDGLIAGSVHPVQTVELFLALDRLGYDGVIYFDTFPDHGGTDPVGEARANIAVTDRLRAIARTLAGNADLAAAQARQDAAAATRIVMAALYGA